MDRIEDVNVDEAIDAMLLSTNSLPEAEIVKKFLDVYNAKLRYISCALDDASRSGVAETMEKLGLGLTKLHEFAMFIRRDYDDYDPDQGPMTALLGQLHQAFTLAESRAERGLRETGDLHAQVIGDISKLRDRIGLLSSPFR
jgi:hypothetical protein